MPFVRLTFATDRGPVSVFHALAEIPRVGDTITLGDGRTVLIKTVDDRGGHDHVQATGTLTAEPTHKP